MTEGDGLLKICKDEGMPSRATLYRWLETHSGFRDRYARAREAQMDYYAELIREVAFDSPGDIFIEDGKAVADHARVQRDRLKVDALKWIASKLFSRQYGDKAGGPNSEEPPSRLVVSWKERSEEPVTRIERIIIHGVRADGSTVGDNDPLPADKPAHELRQIAYNPTPPPADLSPEAWSRIARVSELIEQIAPNDEMPEAVFGIIEAALHAHYLGAADAVSATKAK